MDPGILAEMKAPLSLSALMVNLAVAIVLSLILKAHYEKFASTLGNKRNFSNVLPLICLVTVLIITVVKTSLALSLGLVGALSIVRFRTPIKEPEELGYLFLCIAIGLGLGANQTMATAAVAPVILIVIAGIKIFSNKDAFQNYFLNLQMAGNVTAAEINSVLSEYLEGVDLKRLDTAPSQLQAVYAVQLGKHSDLDTVIDKLREKLPEINVTFTDLRDIEV